MDTIHAAPRLEAPPIECDGHTERLARYVRTADPDQLDNAVRYVVAVAGENRLAALIKRLVEGCRP